MAVITGADGQVQFDLGGGAVCTANVFQWTANLGRQTLDTTRQGDEGRRRTGGLADHTGTVSLRLQFSDDTATANSAWQLLDFALGNVDDGLKAGLTLYVQMSSTSGLCDGVFGSTFSDAVSLTGSVVVADVRMDCSDVTQPVVAVLNWEADGALTLQRT